MQDVTTKKRMAEMENARPDNPGTNSRVENARPDNPGTNSRVENARPDNPGTNSRGGKRDT